MKKHMGMKHGQVRARACLWKPTQQDFHLGAWVSQGDRQEHKGDPASNALKLRIFNL